MAERPGSQQSESKRLGAIIEAGKKAFDPSAPASSRQTGLEEYHQIIESTETWALIPALNAVIKPDTLPPWLREHLMQTLTTLPLRPNGVRGTMEFVFSVHPSNNSQAGGSSEPKKEGASITHEAVAVATRLLSSVPSSMTPQAWFQGISEQLLRLMDGEAGPDLAKTAAQIVGFGILGKKQFGAPGSPGWNAFVQPLLQNINPSLRSQESADAVMTDTTTAEFVDLTADRVLVQSKLLEQSLKRLKILILSNPSPGLCRRVLRPVLLQIWALASWGNPSKGSEEAFKNPARALMQTFLRLFGNVDTIMPLVENICCKGSLPSVTERWKYHLSPTGIIDIVVPRSLSDADVDLNEIDAKSIEMVNLISDTCSAEETSSIFLHLLRRWIQTAESQSDSTSNIRLSPEALQLNTPVQELVEVTILQKLLDQAPEKLVSHFDQLLDLICGVFKVDERKRLDDDMIGVVLSLLNLVITAPNFQKSDIKSDELEVVEASLSRLSLEDRSDVSSTARNLSMLLRFRDQLEAGEHSGSAPNGGLVEDRRTYNLAMSYITGGGDNPPPVVSEGLNLLSTLVLKESPILDIPALTVLMSNLLKDNEDFINLRVIRIFTQLANKHPKSTTRELIDHYLDAQEKSSTDVRLRFGEALLQVIERLGDTFAEDIAQQVSETLLSIAGRRGYRPKMMGQQAREEKLRQMKQEKAGDNVDDENLSEDDVLGEKERADNDIISQIVKGWDSKRGSEDIRMRASALSILGSAIETNIGGVGPELASASVDLCINILTLEPELEKSILRRAAILLILSFVKALDKAREVRRSLGFGLTDQSREDIMRTLQYVASTDNDGLVQQHARDVVDSLESWQIASIIPQQNEASTSGLTRLAGLKVNPEANSANEADRSRPKIEEVE